MGTGPFNFYVIHLILSFLGSNLILYFIILNLETKVLLFIGIQANVAIRNSKLAPIQRRGLALGVYNTS